MNPPWTLLSSWQRCGGPGILTATMALVMSGTVPALSQEQGSPLSPQAIQQRTGIEWRTISREPAGQAEVVRRLSRPHPDPSRAGKAGLQIVGKDQAEGLAKAFALKNASLFVPSTMSLVADDLVPEVLISANTREYQERGTEYTVVLSHLFQSIPVYGSQFRVSITQYGEIWLVKNRLVALDHPPTSPKLSEKDGIEAARRLLGDEKASPASGAQLMVFGPSRLVWRMDFFKPHFQELMVDAVTGEKVLMRSNVVTDSLPATGEPGQGHVKESDED